MDQQTTATFAVCGVIIDEDAVINALMHEVRAAMRQASYFKNYKRGQIVLSFDEHGTYKGVIITMKD